METVLDFLVSLRPMLPYSTEQPGKLASNSEVRRWCNSKTMIVLNGETVKKHDQEMQYPVTQLVFFPKSHKRKTTIY
jgi:hypothetical protein